MLKKRDLVGSSMEKTHAGSGWLVLAKLLRQSAMPAIVSAGYAYWDYSTSASPTAATFVKSFGISFFLIMWFVGQWLRTEKQLADAADTLRLSRIQANIDHLTAAVRIADAAAPTTSQEVQIHDAVSRTLLDEAEQAMSGGLARPALLTAAIAYEHAVRKFADLACISDAYRAPLPKLITLLEGVLQPSIIADLQGLWNLHNSIVHSGPADQLDVAVAKRFYDSFRWAIGFLTQHASRARPIQSDEITDIEELQAQIRALRAQRDETVEEMDRRIRKVESERDEYFRMYITETGGMSVSEAAFRKSRPIR